MTSQVEMWASIDRSRRVMVEEGLAREPFPTLIRQKLQAIEEIGGEPVTSAEVTENYWQDGHFITLNWESASGAFSRIFEVIRGRGGRPTALEPGNEKMIPLDLTYTDPRVKIHYRINESGYNYEGQWYNLAFQVIEILREIDHKEGPYLRAEAAPFQWEMDENFSSVMIRWVTRDGSFARLFDRGQDIQGRSVLVPSIKKVHDPHPMVNDEMQPLVIAGKEKPGIKIARSLIDAGLNEKRRPYDFPELVWDQILKKERTEGPISRADAVPVMLDTRHGLVIWSVILRWWANRGSFETRLHLGMDSEGKTTLI